MMCTLQGKQTLAPHSGNRLLIEFFTPNCIICPPKLTGYLEMFDAHPIILQNLKFNRKTLCIFFYFQKMPENYENYKLDVAAT